MDCSPPVFSVRGISQQEYWGGLPFRSLEYLTNPRIELHLLHCRLTFYHWAMREALEDSYFNLYNALAWGRALQKDAVQKPPTLTAAHSWLKHDFSGMHRIECKACPRKSYYISWNFFDILKTEFINWMHYMGSMGPCTTTPVVGWH